MSKATCITCLIGGLIGAQFSRQKGYRYEITYTVIGGAVACNLFVIGFDLLIGWGELAPVGGLHLAIASLVGSVIGLITWCVLEFCGHYGA
jgi:lipopolysaccharide export LptBFGC system permease protein LptF